MKKISYTVILLSTLLVTTLVTIAACDDPNEEQELVTGEPVETRVANTKYEPAFKGQTRIGSVITETAWKKEVLTSALTSPWGIASLPDGRLLITQKTGTMRIVTTAGVVSGEIDGLPAVVNSGQGGLLGLCIDPDFTTNRMVYWVFTEGVSGGNKTAVAKGKLSTDESTIEGAVVIFRSNHTYNNGLHYGGRILFDNSNNLLVSIGERSDGNTRVLAQSVTVTLGKVVRITKDGSPASGNPSFSEAGALAELYTMGHRNPQGLALHPETGDIWLGEHGPQGGDEINRLRAGKNYGWPVITYGEEYGAGDVKIGAGIQQKEGMEQPVYYWDPVIAPGGMTFYTGNRVPEWENNLFVTSLKETHIARLVIRDNKVVGEERLLKSENRRFRDIVQGTDGALYAITDPSGAANTGRLYRIDKE